MKTYRIVFFLEVPEPIDPSNSVMDITTHALENLSEIIDLDANVTEVQIEEVYN